MALNLSTLTSPTTSSDIIADIENPAASGDLVVTLKNLATESGATTNATQTVSAAQGTAVQGDTSYLVMDLVDDEYEFTTDSAINGTIVVATLEGTYSANISLDASTQYDLQARGVAASANYGFLKNPVGYLISSSPLSESEITQMENYFVDQGAAARSAFGSVTNFYAAWRDCSSLTSFPLIDTSSGTNFAETWYNCNSLTSFPLIDTSSGTNFNSSWRNCSSLTSFPALDTSSGTAFNNAWNNCDSLTSFPADINLGTNRPYANFIGAWKSSGLTSFSTPLPTAVSCQDAWRSCSSLTDFNLDTLPTTNLSSAFNNSGITSWSTELPNVTNCKFAWYYSQIASFNISSMPSATSVQYAWISTPLTSFATSLPVCQNFAQAWQTCRSLTDFSADVFSNWNPSSVSSGVFNLTWVNCTSLTSQSVENILTSIDTSGVYGTNTGASGGTQLADNTIDIDYDTATGSLSTATNSAITSLKSKNWAISINNVIQ